MHQSVACSTPSPFYLPLTPSPPERPQCMGLQPLEVTGSWHRAAELLSSHVLYPTERLYYDDYMIILGARPTKNSKAVT